MELRATLVQKEGLNGGSSCRLSSKVKDTINFTVLVDLQDPSFEMLWAQLRPARLPRGCNSIVVGALYHPPSASDPAIMEYQPLNRAIPTVVF